MASKLDFMRLPAPDGVNGWWESLPPVTRFAGELRFDYVVVAGGVWLWRIGGIWIGSWRAG